MPDDREYHPRGLLHYPTYVFGKLHKSVHAELGTPLREHWVLTYLAESGDISQQEMAHALAIDRSEVVRLIDTMEKAGLVTRTRSAEDRRKNTVTITEAGRRRWTETDALIQEATAAQLFRLTPAERTELHRLSLKAIGWDLGEL
ncbi:MarR family winged helix-turn-helix transcriptional regulator [Nocardia sp. NPDC020380]|uniref:MarR family winged helix-turn-helix transcriptional regulator n=1 Tax=Nocardia sp. NPDC020380 TaxID=3364309 RepID=UPI00378DBB4C